MFAFLISPALAFIGPLVTVLWQWLARIFVKGGFYRILGLIALVDVFFITINNVISFFFEILKSKMGTFSVPADICFVLDSLGIFTIASFYVSVLISIAVAKYFLQITLRLMS